MIEHLTYMELGDKLYPIKCDLAVLEAVQEEFGKLSDFELSLSGAIPTGKKDNKGKRLYRQGEPSMKAVRFVLPLMINEGIDLENQLEGKKREHVTEKILRAELTVMNVFDLADQLHQEFIKCFKSKNLKSTQEEEEKSR